MNACTVEDLMCIHQHVQHHHKVLTLGLHCTTHSDEISIKVIFNSSNDASTFRPKPKQNCIMCSILFIHYSAFCVKLKKK